MKIYYWIWGDPSSEIELQPYCGGTTVVIEKPKILIEEGYVI